MAAYFEMRPLSFAEVKKEIDTGGIVQMDGNNSESTDAPGIGDNLGHSVAIVGYVMPTSGSQILYYIVWNPWWASTFYLSTQVKTYNLGSVKYQWTRTWHNWRQVSDAGSHMAVSRLTLLSKIKKLWERPTLVLYKKRRTAL